jgi:hypothetical protein
MNEADAMIREYGMVIRAAVLEQAGGLEQALPIDRIRPRVREDAKDSTHDAGGFSEADD